MNSKKLFDIVPEFLVSKWVNKENSPIVDLVFDSRKVVKGSLFIAIEGIAGDGHDFVEKAYKKGAVAVIIQKDYDRFSDRINVILVDDSRLALAALAAEYYDNPSKKIKLIGVTGTNGKTTIVTLLYQLFEKMGYKSGLISTVCYSNGAEMKMSSHTTPDPIMTNKLLSEMVYNKCDFAFMEVSSHAIDQKRVEYLHFEGGVFTNLSHDHLDYHNTFKEYLNTKKKFFDFLDSNSFALYNLDDKNGKVMVQNSKARKIGYSLKTITDIKGKIISNSFEGLHLSINDSEIYARLVGNYNAYNMLASYGVARELLDDKESILLGLSQLEGAVGRFELIRGKKKKVFAIVDYAHTPDALENILTAIVELINKSSKVICVVGCGGDRDRTKRPLMAQIACNLSDLLIMTSDNPRSEDPEKIIDEMEKGLLENEKEKCLRIIDRRQAIKTAVMMSAEGDVILIAGKGHEKYQEINGVKKPFDDKKEIETLVL